jgi:Crp-like helix-turn-helix domain
VSWLVDVVPPTEKTRVASALASCSLLSLPAGSSVGADRFEAIPLLLVEDGVVFVSAMNRGSARRVIMSLTGPDSILVAPAARERLGALADARLILISASTQKRLFDSPTAASVIVEAVEGGLRTCRESLAQFGSRRHIDRVRLKLVQLARAHGTVGTDGLLLDIPLTHELLADMVGSTRETVTRSLAHLSQEGLIRRERGRYLLAAPPEAIAR